MSRATRLLELLELLRRHRYAVSGEKLATQLGVSLRTLYRDIATLQAQGAQIEGEAGLGYVLRPGFTLPPLMFSEEEIEALVLGTRWVAEHADGALGNAAQQALAKIAAVLPSPLRHELETSPLIIGPGAPMMAGDTEVATIRHAIRRERKLQIHYRDVHGAPTERVVWPFALGFFDYTRVVAAWCELRGGFRHFRTDRISEIHMLDQRYPRRRHALFKEWQLQQGIPADKN